MTQLAVGALFLQRKKGSREEEAGANHQQAPRGLLEGWDGVGGPPSPLSSLDPWGITGTNKLL